MLATATRNAARGAICAVRGDLGLGFGVTTCFSGTASQVIWQGQRVLDATEFDEYLSSTVASRLEDTEQGKDFEADMRALASTGVATDTLEDLLQTEPARKPWEVGEALAECVLEEGRGVTWPWNMERDKRTPKVSLPGADIVGFLVEDDDIYMALGEVKTSFDAKRPPEVLYGRGGMITQLDRLAREPAIHLSLLKWLYARCKSTIFWPMYQQATARYLRSGGREIVLFGLLMRDMDPHEHDIQGRAQSLASQVVAPTRVELTAWHLPRPISNWPQIAARSA